MAERQAQNYRTIQHSGEYGNCRMAVLEDTLAADGIADVIQLGQIAGSSRIVDVILYNAALGASTTLDVGYRYLTTADGTDDENGFIAAQDTSSAVRTSMAGDVDTIADGDGVEIVAVVGGAAATGKITVVVLYDWVGQ